jgi:hypothetical protein
MEKENQTAIPCCPELIKDDHFDIIDFSRVLTYTLRLQLMAAGAGHAKQYFFSKKYAANFFGLARRSV